MYLPEKLHQAHPGFRRYAQNRIPWFTYCFHGIHSYLVTILVFLLSDPVGHGSRDFIVGCSESWTSSIYFVMRSWGSWICKACSAVGFWTSWSLFLCWDSWVLNPIFCFVVRSWWSWILTKLFYCQILRILDHEIIFYCWILIFDSDTCLVESRGRGSL